MHTIRVIMKLAKNARRTDRASASSRLCLSYTLASISCEHCRSSRHNPHYAPRHIIYYYFCPNLFSYRFEPIFEKWCDSNKSRFIFLGKRFSTTWPFPMFENEFFNGWNYKKTLFQNKIFINKLLYLIIINSISKIGNIHIVENLFSEKVIHDL